MNNVDIYDKYLNVIFGECVSAFDENKLDVGKRYRLGSRYNSVVGKQVYHVIAVTDILGMPIYVEI